MFRLILTCTELVFTGDERDSNLNEFTIQSAWIKVHGTWDMENFDRTHDKGFDRLSYQTQFSFQCILSPTQISFAIGATTALLFHFKIENPLINSVST